MLPEGRLRPAEHKATETLARTLVVAVRKARKRAGGLDTFLNEYGLSSPEGVVLMCLAEALLRIADAETANRLIRDKLKTAEWEMHLGRSDSVLVNASTWGLILTGWVISPAPDSVGNLREFAARLVARSGYPRQSHRLPRRARRAARRNRRRRYPPPRSRNLRPDR
jgi:RHH-type proline utilization regulon transcriptional repressor/proline dehydrogenase/delta 1-pyrroline-5-carboxylate dehydrogenase